MIMHFHGLKFAKLTYNEKDCLKVFTQFIVSVLETMQRLKYHLMVCLLMQKSLYDKNISLCATWKDAEEVYS